MSGGSPPATAIGCGPGPGAEACCRLAVAGRIGGAVGSQLLVASLFALSSTACAAALLWQARRRRIRRPKYIVLSRTADEADGYNSQGDTVNGDVVSPLAETAVPRLYLLLVGGVALLALVQLAAVFVPFSPAAHVAKLLLFQLKHAFPVLLLALFFWRDWMSSRALVLSAAFALVYFGLSAGMALGISRAIAASDGAPRIDVATCPLCPLWFFDTLTLVPALAALLAGIVASIAVCSRRLRGPAGIVLAIPLLLWGVASMGPSIALAAGALAGGVCVGTLFQLLYSIGMPIVLLAVVLRDCRTDAMPSSGETRRLLDDSARRANMRQVEPVHYGQQPKGDAGAAAQKQKKKPPKPMTEAERIAKFLLDNLDESVRVVEFDDVVRERKIGAGGFGEVFKGTLEGDEVAIKRVLEMDEKKAKTFLREINTMARLEHPHITKLVGVAISQDDYFLLTEYVHRGSLFDLIHGKKKRQPKVSISWANVLTVLRGTCEGMSFLHGMDPPFLHRDLKSQNLLIGDHWLVKLCDFGMARTRSLAVTMTKLGTLQWVAPEVLRDERYSEKADIYSFAVLVWELVARAVPYVGQNSLMVARAVAYKSLRPVIPDSCPEFFRDLMMTCWTDNASERPSFPEILALLDGITSETANSWPPFVDPSRKK